MKLNSKQLAQHLQQQLAPLYVVSGDEWLLIHEACTAIRTAAKKQGFIERLRYTVTTGFDWNELLNKTHSLSLFSQHRFIELHLENIKISDIGNKALQQLAVAPPPDTVILIKTAKLASATQASAWYKALEKQAVCITIWPLTAFEFQTWIKQRLQQAGLQTSNEGLALIISSCEGNLLAAQQTIEKLQLLYTSGHLTEEAISAAISDSSHYSIFDLTDALLADKPEQAVKILNTIQHEGIEPILILWAITKELRQLYTLATEQQNLNALLQKYRIREAQKPLIKKCLQRLTVKNLQVLLQQSLKVDQMIKGNIPGNVWDGLSFICLSFCKKLSLTILNNISSI